MEEFIEKFSTLKVPEDWVSVVTLVIAGFCLYVSIKLLMGLWDDWMGKRTMKKRAKLSKEVCEIIEDRIVCGLSEAISSKRITIDEARQLYARFAHLGFWGLHPRKFTPIKTPEDLQELKERLQAKRKALSNTENKSTASLANKFLDGIEAEMA